MGQALPQKQYYTKEEYLEMETAADFKSEYYQGEIFAMSGGSPDYSTICLNLNWADYTRTFIITILRTVF